jgi:hypothetical protein
LKSQIVSERELITALDDAAETQTALVVAEENRLVDEETRKQRTAASDIITADAARFESQLKPLLATMRAYAADLGKYAGFRADFGGIGAYLANASNEAELALSVNIPDLRAGALAVLEGREKMPTQPGERS